MKVVKGVVAVMLLGSMCCLAGCGGSSGASVANAETTTSASNVLIDKSKTTLSATTMQGAIDELAPALNSSLLVGTWNLTNYGSMINTGTITFTTTTYSTTWSSGGGTTGTWSVDTNNVLVLDDGMNGVYYPLKASANRIVLSSNQMMILTK